MLNDVSFGAQQKIEPDIESTRVVVVSNGKMLAGIRKQEGTWTLPGGAIDKGETVEQGARRELWEEAGIKPTGHMEYLGAEVSVRKNSTKLQMVHVFRYHTTAKPTTKNDPDDEVHSWEWIDTSHGLKPDMKFHASNNIALKMLGLMDFPTHELDSHMHKRGVGDVVIASKNDLHPHAVSGKGWWHNNADHPHIKLEVKKGFELPERELFKSPKRELGSAHINSLHLDAEYERTGPATGLTTHLRQVAYLKKLCKLRELEFDRSTPVNETVHHLHGFAEAMHDILTATGLPKEMISGGGRLGVRVRSKGLGWTAAKYVPVSNTIQLVQQGETGSLAHEWARFFDYALGEMLYDSELPLSQLVDQADRGKSALRVKAGKSFESKNAIRQAMQALIGYLVNTTGARMVMDAARRGDNLNWITTSELFAHGFEVYLQDRLASLGTRNHYLLGAKFDHRWPTDNEAQVLRPLYETLFRAIYDVGEIKKAEDGLPEIVLPILALTDTNDNSNLANIVTDGWTMRKVTDVGRPICIPFEIGETVYVRRMKKGFPGIEEPIYQMLRCKKDLVSGLWTRRRITQTQLDGATVEIGGSNVSTRKAIALDKGWKLLDPKHAGYWPDTRIPKRFKGYDFYIVDRNPEVKGPGWQGDTIFKPGVPPFHAGIVERAVFVNPPNMPTPERLDKLILDLYYHEWVELRIKGDIVDGEHPYISDEDRIRCMDEVEGLAHALTVQRVEGYIGRGGERRYLEEMDYAIMIELGFQDLVAKWRETDK